MIERITAQDVKNRVTQIRQEYNHPCSDNRCNEIRNNLLHRIAITEIKLEAEEKGATIEFE